MAIKVSNERLNILQRAIELVYDGNVRLNEYYGVWKVAWTAMGAVLPDKAMAVSQAIHDVSMLADTMNFYNVKHEYRPNEMSDAEELEQTAYVEELLKEGQSTQIVEWLGKGGAK